LLAGSNSKLRELPMPLLIETAVEVLKVSAIPLALASIYLIALERVLLG